MFTKGTLEAFIEYTREKSSIGGYSDRLIAIAEALLKIPKPTNADVKRLVTETMPTDYRRHAEAIFTATLTPGKIPAAAPKKAKKVAAVKKIPLATFRKQVVAYIVSRTPERPETMALSARAKAVRKAIDANNFGCQTESVREAAGILIGESLGTFSGHATVRQFAAYECPSNDIVLVLGPSPDNDEAYATFRNDEGHYPEFNFDIEDWVVGATEKQIRSLVEEMSENDLRKTFDFLVD